MNKQEILKKLGELELELDKEQIIILSGASLVLQDVILQTDDIDFTCSREYYNKINWNTKIGAFGIEIKYKDVFEFGYNLYYPEDVILVEGYKCLNLKKCLEIKKELKRDKDKMVIERLENIIKNGKKK